MLGKQRSTTHVAAHPPDLRSCRDGHLTMSDGAPSYARKAGPPSALRRCSRSDPPPNTPGPQLGTANGIADAVSIEVRAVVRNELPGYANSTRRLSGLGPDVVGAGLWRDHNRRLPRGRGTRLLLAWQTHSAIDGNLTIANTRER
jgi:hypothetical protein